MELSFCGFSLCRPHLAWGAFGHCLVIRQKGSFPPENSENKLWKLEQTPLARSSMAETKERRTSGEGQWPVALKVTLETWEEKETLPGAVPHLQTPPPKVQTHPPSPHLRKTPQTGPGNHSNRCVQTSQRRSGTSLRLHSTLGSAKQTLKCIKISYKKCIKSF